MNERGQHRSAVTLALLAALLVTAGACGSAQTGGPARAVDASDAQGGSAGAQEAGMGGSGGLDAGPVDGSEGGPPCVAPVALQHRIALGAGHGCALHADGSAECWGTPFADYGQTNPPKGSFADLDAYLNTNCAVSSADGVISCWGDDPYGITMPPPAGKFVQVAVGPAEACAVSACGRVECWDRGTGGTGAPNVPFAQVTAGDGFFCGITAGGTVQCWGPSSYGQTIPPAGKFKEISSGYSHTCGIRDDGTLACWGAGGPGTPTDGSDPNHVEWGQSIPPSGTFKHVAAGAAHTCGILTDGHVKCWGAGTAVGSCGKPPPGECGQAMPPAGTFKELALGFTNSCGLRTDGKIECWGSNTGGRSTPPTDFP